MLLKSCRCGKLIPQSMKMCEECERQQQSRHMIYNNTRRDERAAEFYISKEWRAMRERIIEVYENIDISVIMFACDELHFATGAQAMIHKPLCMAYGNADDFKAVIKQLNLCEDSILDVYMEHVQEGVTRDKIQSLMSNETWFDSKKMQQYFNVEIEEKAAVAACASDYFEKYNNIPETLKGTETENIVDAVLAELEKRNNAAAQAEEQRIEAEKREILDDLYLYGM